MNFNESEIERHYNYRPTWTLVLLASLFFGSAMALFVYLALTNEKPIVLNGLIRLSPFGGRIFFWALAALSAMFVAGATLLAYVRLTSVQRIALTHTGIALPTGKWSRRDEAFIAFKDIAAIHVIEHRGNKYVYIDALGLRYTILPSSLAKRDFDEIMFALEANTTVKRRE